jgi:uncharacterized protein YndB with AHSA1/START domain
MADSSTHPSAVAQTAGHEIVITRVFDAPRERVWHAGMPPGEMAEMTGAGWDESFDKLAAMLEQE